MYFFKYVGASFDYIYPHMDNNAKIKLSFTLNNRKNTFLRRMDIYGEPITTTNESMARAFKQKDVPYLLKKLITKYGKENIKDINPKKVL